jgi:hypothetical protein
MTDWTPAMVEQRLEEAVDTLDRLPEERVRGFYSYWPDMISDFSDKVGQTPDPMRRPPPSPAAISRMDEVLTWMKFLDPEDARLVWARAERTPWKQICWRFGIARATACRRWQYGIAVITLRLNGHRVATKRSTRYVIERAKNLSR